MDTFFEDGNEGFGSENVFQSASQIAVYASCAVTARSAVTESTSSIVMRIEESIFGRSTLDAFIRSLRIDYASCAQDIKTQQYVFTFEISVSWE